MGARYYDPITARFTSPDRVTPSPEEPQDWNLYAFGRNNPLTYTDPSGNVVDAVVDAAGLAAGLHSIANWNSDTTLFTKVLDVGGVIGDGVSLALPLATVGGAGVWLKALREGGEQAAKHGDDIVQGVDTIADAARGGGDFTVRRFMSKAELKQLKKDGVPFDPARGEGIPTTTRNFTPKNQSVARQRTGAPQAEFQVDIDVTGLPRGPTTSTRSGLPEFPIRGDLTRDRILDVRRVPK